MLIYSPTDGHLGFFQSILLKSKLIVHNLTLSTEKCNNNGSDRNTQLLLKVFVCLFVFYIFGLLL